MNYKRLVAIKSCILSAALAAPVAISAQSDQIIKEGERKISEGQASQARIDKIVDSSQQRIIEYRSLLKQIEGLKTYNEQLETQLQSQADLIARFENSTNQVAIIERQMLPLILKMVESLKSYVDIDLPFSTEERLNRLAFLEEAVAKADVDVAEKFRLVLEAYQIESQYGRTIGSYQDVINLNGEEKEVDILQVGRVALVAQTKDTETSAVWDKANQTWEILDNGTYRNSIRRGIKMSKKQAPLDILTLPIQAPSAQGGK